MACHVVSNFQIFLVLLSKMLHKNHNVLIKIQNLSLAYVNTKVIFHS